MTYTDNDNILRSYGYTYDEMNRLKGSYYQKEYTETNSYDEHLTYDKNGNILTLNRNGFVDGNTPGMTYPIDELNYMYENNNKSNRLVSVADHTNSIDGFKDGNLSGVDYDYDDFGNMIRDRNKGIDKIFYNHLNLPTKIVFSNSSEIYYIYNAVGVKLGKRIVDNDNTVPIDDSTLYLGGFHYLNDVLQFFSTSEGYVSVTGTNYNYVFNYTDHLGNIRLSYTKDPATGVLKILEQSHYYPYGMKHANYNDSKHDYGHEEGGIFAIIKPVIRSNYQYKYNGKEYQDELGLNLYDMDFRDYDPAIARWTGIDPVTHHSQSTYNAFDGNPLFWADPSGADATITDNAVTFDGADAQAFITAFIGLMDGNDSSFTIAGAIYDLTDIADGNYTGIIVGSNGIVYDKFGSGSNYRIFDRKGEQLYLNDYANDSQWLGTMGVGDRLYHSISVATFASMILDAGVKIRGGIGGYYNIAWQSHMGGADFGARQIANKFDIPYSKTEYSIGGAGDGNFFRFGNQKSLYNLADAGNFMWGAWMKGNSFFYMEARAGSQLNNFVSNLLSTGRTNGWTDSNADQRAIRNGYYYLHNLLLSWRK